MRIDKRPLSWLVAGVLGIDACLHLLWATGATWPAADTRLLSYLLLGFEASFAPSLLLPLAAVLIAAAAATRWAAATGNRLARLLVLVLLYGLAARGILGLVWSTGVGVPPEYPAFYWANLLLYTPLCLLLAAACARIRYQDRPPTRWHLALLVLPLLPVAAVPAAAYGWTPEPRAYDPAEAGIESRYLETDIARFHYTKTGSGSPVVLLSPGASWVYAWQPQAEALAEHHTVYVVDMPGQGFTELRTEDFDYTLDAMNSAVDGFLTAADLDRVALAGNSWSGGWALSYAAAEPDRVERLLLLAPSGADRPDPAAWEALKTPVLGELATHLYADDREAARASLENLFADDSRVTDAVVDANWAVNTRPENLSSVYLLERGLDWSRTEAAMPDVEQPVLLQPRLHCDLHDMPRPLSAALGPMLQRVERAIRGLDGIGRVHVNKWGDGGAHLHWFLIARPAGMMQLRGSCLPLWDDVLPKQPAEEWLAANRRIAAAMAAEGGTAHV